MAPNIARGGTARCVAAVLLVACAAVAGVRSVAVDFRPARERLIQNDIRPAPGQLATATVPATGQPLSVIVAQVCGGDQAAPVQIRVDGRVLATVDVAARTRKRIDVQSREGLRPGSVIQVSSTSNGWTLSYLEAANLHGYSSGIFNAFFVPASRNDFLALPWWLMAAVFAAFTALWTPPREGRHPRIEFAAACLGTLVWVLALIAPFISRYAIVLSVPTFLLCGILVFGPSVRRRYKALRSRLAVSNPARARALAAAIVGLTVLAFYVAVVGHELAGNKYDYSAFLRLSETFAHAPVLDDHADVRASLKTYPTGYDGQFMFLMAFDPLLTKYEPASYTQIVDWPPYRYGRIGFSLLTLVFSGGQPAAFPRTMMWLILASHFVAAFAVASIAADRGGSPWQALPYILVPGFLVSLATALPESIAAALLVAGLWACTRQRYWIAAGLWGLSLLVRETGIFLVVIVIGWTLLQPGRRRRAMQLLAAFAPVAAWRLYAGWRLFPAFGGWRVFWNDPGDLTWPFGGLLHLLAVNDVAHGHGQAFNTWFPPLFIALLALAIALLVVRRTPVAAAAVTYGILAVMFNYEKVWLWVGNVERLTCELFLLTLVAALPFGSLPRPLRWGLVAFGVALFAYDFHAAPYATWFRPGFVVIR